MRTSQVFTWLSLSEPPGGPISTYLRMPAPLDSMLFLLRNEDAEHRLPMVLHVPTAGLSGAGALSHAIAAYAVRAAAGRATLALQGAGAPLDALPELRRVRHVATIQVAVFALLALGAVVLGLVGGAQGAAAGFVVSFVLIGGPAVLWLGTLGVGHWLGAVRAVASTS